MSGRNLNELLETFDLDKESSWLVIREENEIDKGHISWNVKKTDLDKKVGCCITSNYFNLGTRNYCSHLRISIYPQGRNQSCEKFMSVCISFNKKPIEGTEIKGVVSLMDAHGEAKITRKFYGIDENLKAVTLDNFAETEFLSKYLVNDELILGITIKIKSRLAECVSDKTKYVVSPSFVTPDVCDKILDCSSLSDVKLKVGTEQFKAHKAILAAHAPNFKEVFQVPRETYDLKNVESPMFKKWIKYIYEDEIPLLNFATACKLFEVAHKYNDVALQGICSAYLGANLFTKNVFIVQTLANNFNDSNLKKACIDFVKKCNPELLADESVLNT